MSKKKRKPEPEEASESRLIGKNSVKVSDTIIKGNEGLLKVREAKVNKILAEIPASLLKDFDKLYEPITAVDAHCAWSRDMPKSCKVLIKCNSSPNSIMALDDVDDVFMVFVDDEFCRVFLYNQTSFCNFPLHRLVPLETAHQLKVIKNALLRGKSVMEFLAMIRSDKVLLNTHVTLTCINGSSKMINDKLNLIEQVSAGNNDCAPIECWGVLTIRNSRCISEAKYSGIGLFGKHEIVDSNDRFGDSRDVRDIIPDKGADS